MVLGVPYAARPSSPLMYDRRRAESWQQSLFGHNLPLGLFLETGSGADGAFSARLASWLPFMMWQSTSSAVRDL